MSVCYKVKEAKNKPTEETSRCCQMFKRYNLVKVGSWHVYLVLEDSSVICTIVSTEFVKNLGDWARRKKKSNAEKIAEEIQECCCCVH